MKILCKDRHYRSFEFIKHKDSLGDMFVCLYCGRRIIENETGKRLNNHLCDLSSDLIYDFNHKDAKLSREQYEKMVSEMNTKNNTDLLYKYGLNAQKIGEIRNRLGINLIGRGRPIENKNQHVDILPLKRIPWSEGRRKKKGWIKN